MKELQAMKNRHAGKAGRLLCLALAAVLLSGALLAFGQQVQAETQVNVMVFVNRELLQFEESNKPQIINSRTMVPVRPLAEALGAEINWNDAEKKVTIVTNSEYAVLVIGQPVMTYGSFAKDAAGNQTPTSTQSFPLDSPPVIINERSLFPASAIATAFGAEVAWVDETKTVFITTQEQPEPSPVSGSSTAPSPAASDQPADPAFADTTWFVEASGKRIQEMHDNKNKFAVVLYDGKDSAARTPMSMIKSAAAESQFKIYGFDWTSSRFTDPDLCKWVWDIADKGSDYPIIILSYHGKEDELLPSGISESELVKKLKNLKQDVPELPSSTKASPSPSPSASARASRSPSASASSSAKAASGYKWERLDIYDAEEKLDDGDRFVYFVYDSSKDDYYRDYYDAMQEAAKNEGLHIYYYDLRSVAEDEEWFAYNNFGGVFTPCVIMLIEDYEISDIAPTTKVSTLESFLTDFLD